MYFGWLIGPPFGSVSNNGDHRQRITSAKVFGLELLWLNELSQLEISLSRQGLTAIKVDMGEPSELFRFAPNATDSVRDSMKFDEVIC